MCQLLYNWIPNEHRSQMFYKLVVPKNFAKFPWKHLRPVTVKDSSTGVSCEFCKIFKNFFFAEYLWTTTSGLFHSFYCFLPPSEVWILFIHFSVFCHPVTNRNQFFFYFWTCFITGFERDEYEEFCCWKTIFCELKFKWFLLKPRAQKHVSYA